MALSTHADAKKFDVDKYSFFPLAVPSRGSKELAIWHLDAGAGEAPVLRPRDELLVIERQFRDVMTRIERFKRMRPEKTMGRRCRRRG